MPDNQYRGKIGDYAVVESIFRDRYSALKLVEETKHFYTFEYRDGARRRSKIASTPVIAWTDKKTHAEILAACLTKAMQNITSETKDRRNEAIKIALTQFLVRD